MTRKLAAILVADMVGYSRLMAADEAGTLARLKALRAELIDPEIASNEGRIVKVMGDGMLVVFDSVVAAVGAAAAVQKAMTLNEAGVPPGRRIAFRIGIHLGDIIIDGDDIYGDGVNLAARLEGIAAPGGICVSEDVWRQVRGKVELHFDDLGEKELKNIPGKIRVYGVNLDPARLTPEAFEALTGERLELPDKPSIAVLPFENMSGDAEQEYFADGIAEDILTTLSKISDMVVIARNSTFVYKDRAVDIRQVGRDLGVRYVLEGSVQKGGDRVRITAQLIDTQSGDHVWAERYDRTLDDIFAVQDEITREIVVALSVKLGHGEEVRIWSGGSKSFEAWECVSRGFAAHLQFTKEGNRTAQRLVRKALQIEPDDAMARAVLAWALIIGGRYGFLPDREAALVEAEALVAELIALDSMNADGHALMGNLHATRLRFDEAVASGERAIELAPSVATNHALLALTLQRAGRFQECLLRIRRAIRLSPYFPDWFLIPLGEGYRGTGQLEKARDVFEYYAARAPDTLLSQARLACIHAELGDEAQARAAAETVLSLDPGFSVARFLDSAPLADQVERDKFAAGLLKAGLPE
jgi:adenylate cyclase